jgi:hypothetical protein
LRIVLRAFGILIFGLIGGLILAEGAVRLYLDVLPGPRHPVYLPDPEAGYRLNPEAAAGDTAGAVFHVNALGFRDREHPAVKPPGVRRILGIGDSFVLGEVIPEHNFLRRVEDELNHPPLPPGLGAPAEPTRSPAGRLPALRAEMILLGLGGYNPENYVGVLHEIGLPLKPDYAILCFYVGNDVTGLASPERILRGQLYTVGSYNPLINLLRKSRLYVFLERQVLFRLRRARLAHRSEGAAPQTAVPRPGADSTSSPGGAEAGPSRFYRLVEENRLPIFLHQTPMAIEALWAEAEHCLMEFDADSRAAGVPWGLVVIPDEIQVNTRLRHDVLARLGQDEALYDMNGPQLRLKDLATRRGVPFLDLLPVFIAEDRPDSALYYPNDTHWSGRGNRIAARAVTDFLTLQFAQEEVKRPARSARRKEPPVAASDSLARLTPPPRSSDR